jgi:uncharacterized protein YxjI
LRAKLLSIGDDFWIEDRGRPQGLPRRRQGAEDPPDVRARGPVGREVAKLQERKLSVRDKMEIERDGRSLATVRSGSSASATASSIEVENGHDMIAKGNLVDHEYEIERDGDTVAEVSKSWFRIRDTYGVEIAPGEDEALVLAITVCIDAMSHPRD